MDTIQKIQSALTFVPSDLDRDTWTKVGMSIEAELGQDGFDVFDNWSAGGKTYNARATLSAWKSFKGSGVTIGSLYYIAKGYGWVPEPGVKPTPEQLAKQKAEADARAAARAAESARLAAVARGRAAELWDAAVPATDDHPYLKRKGVKAHGLRVGRWEIADSQTGEVRLISKQALLVPICDRQKELHSLQGIFSSKAIGGRDKDYLRDGAKSGNFHALGARPLKHGDRLVFILAEGYATAASIHEASGHLVLVCFDTSNLVTVAKAIRERQPAALILVAGDNDRWNRRPDGTPYNPGLTAATKAANEAQAIVALPPFSDADQAGVDERGDPLGPTDWNDWDQKYGRESVAELIGFALDGHPVPPPPAGPQPDEPELAGDDAPADPAPWDDAGAIPGFEDPAPVAAAPAAEPVPPADDDDEPDTLNKNRYFTVLGYDGSEYFLFSHIKKQIMSVRKSSFDDLGLAEMAPLNWWELNFPGRSGVSRGAAFEWLIQAAHARGIYDPTRVRGRGCWRDNGRFVFHYGSHLTIDGQYSPIEAIESAFVYPMAHAMPKPADVTLSDDEGRHLLAVAEMVRWSMPGSAALMAGWAFLAPICGALKWRPHIWITGGAGSGKTTVQRDFCVALTAGYSIYAQGGSSEAGIRQRLKADSRPVLMDESESNDEGEKRRIEGILALIRQSSSESQAETLKGTVSGHAQHFHVRSMFCLASINVNLEKQADSDRITKLIIRPQALGGGLDHWEKLEDELHKISTDRTISNRLMSRAMGMLPVISEAVHVFVRAAAKRFSSQRIGDQFGTLLAGCWCLTQNHVPSDAEALELIDRYNWTEHVEEGELDDSRKALSILMGRKIKMPGSIGDLSVFELIREASTLHREGVLEQDIADRTLRRHGVRLEKDVLMFGTSVPNLKELLANTPYSTDLRGQLLRLPGATRSQNSVRFNGQVSKCVVVPVKLILGDDPPPAPAQDDDYPL